MAILIAAREWTQQYEWNAHVALAEEAGLKPTIIAAIGDGRRPLQMTEEEEALYDLCIELHRTKNVSDVTYDRALATLWRREDRRGGGDRRLLRASGHGDEHRTDTAAGG